jgi:hypothetical protein
VQALRRVLGQAPPAAGASAPIEQTATECIPQLLEEIVRLYYQKIDAQDIAWVIDLFAPDAWYKRGESEFLGKDALAQFFRKDRQITGKHTIFGLWIHGYGSIVKGLFQGHGAEGKPKEVEFADFWVFNTQGYVHRRQTFLALGSSYVQR